MKVQAAPGLLCPTENNPREYITDSTPLDVADSAYYRRLVADGSLMLVTGDQGRGTGKKTAGTRSPVPDPQATERSA